MRIVFSFLRVCPGINDDIAEYTKSLVETLLKDFPEIEVHLIENTFTYGHYCDVPDAANCNRHLVRSLKDYQREFDQLMSEITPDIIFHPVADSQMNPAYQEKSIVCISDLRHEYDPKSYSKEEIHRLRAIYHHAIKSSCKIIALSEYLGHYIIDHYQLRSTQVQVISPAAQPGFQDKVDDEIIAGVLRQYGLEQDEYLYYPSSLLPYKNHEQLFKALVLLRDRSKNISLVLAGDDANNYPRIEGLVKLLQLENQVKYLGCLSIEERKCLLSGAISLVLPSLYEEFSTSALEAFSTGIPVCCSQSRTMQEIVGDAGLFFDAASAESIADAIENIIESEAIRQTLKFTGNMRSKNSHTQNQLLIFLVMANSIKEKPSTIEVSESPLVSIITPSYNQSEFIGRTIDSVLSQDYRHIEYMVFDGASKDNTVEILKEYGDRVSWVSEPDKGQTNAINKGLKRAKGSILAYLNSDDTLLPGAVSKVVEIFNKTSNISLLYGRANYIDAQDNLLREYPSYPWDFDRYVNECIICQPAAFWTDKTVKRFGYFDETLNYAMDYEYWMRIAMGDGLISFLPELLANSREYETTKTKSAQPKIFLELAEISQRYLGEVSYHWCFTYSHYLFEKRLQFLKSMTGARNFERLKHLTSQIVRYNLNQQPLLDKLKHSLKARGLLKSSEVTVQPRERVEGMYADGWVSMNLTRKYSSPVLLRNIILEGETPKPNTLQIKINGDEIHPQQIDTGAFCINVVPTEKLINSIEVTADKPVIMPGDSRNLAYLLNYANFFSELYY